MATYLMLSHSTAEGIKTVKETWQPDRLKELNREVETLGAKVLLQYALLGPYDFATILEAPNPETMVRLSVELGRRGMAHYENLPGDSRGDLHRLTAIATPRSSRRATLTPAC